MKILSILFLVILLAMTMGCGNQYDSVQASSDDKFAEFEERLSKLEKQIIDIHIELGTGLQDYPVGSPEWWSLQAPSGEISQLQKRVTELEKKLGIKHYPWP